MAMFIRVFNHNTNKTHTDNMQILFFFWENTNPTVCLHQRLMVSNQNWFTLRMRSGLDTSVFFVCGSSYYNRLMAKHKIVYLATSNFPAIVMSIISADLIYIYTRSRGSCYEIRCLFRQRQQENYHKGSLYHEIPTCYCMIVLTR